MFMLYILLVLAVLWLDAWLATDGLHSVVTVLLLIALYQLHQVKKQLRELKDTVDKRLPPSKPTWTCVCCGTENRGDSSLCANCNTQREWSNRKAQEEK